MSRLTVHDIDISLLEELIDGKFISDYDGLIEAYNRGIANRLSKDTGISFSSNIDEVYNKNVDIHLNGDVLGFHNSNTYEDLLDLVNSKLGTSGSNARFESELKNRFGYTFGDRGSYIPYFETDELYWKAYSDYGQEDILELIYYGIYGEYHKDRGYALELRKKYFEQDDWNKPYYYSGRIDELGIDVTFMKNGKMKIKTKMPKEFWEKILEFYDIVDSKGNHHVL